MPALRLAIFPPFNLVKTTGPPMKLVSRLRERVGRPWVLIDGDSFDPETMHEYVENTGAAE